jgi:hypothetical protein
MIIAHPAGGCYRAPMNAWTELLGQVELWIVGMASEDPPFEQLPGETYLSAVERVLEQTEASTQSACVTLAERQTMPRLTSAERFHLWQRLEYAREFLLSLQSAPLEMPATEATLKWLLLNCWIRGRQRLLQRARDASAE